MNSDDTDTRSVRERYPHAFPPCGENGNQSKNPANNAGSMVRKNYEQERDDSIRHTDDGNIIFPTENVETEKHKRNIH
jgi:hypothetical protein